MCIRDRYVAPKPKLSRREQREQRAAAYGTGGKFEDNFMRKLFGGAGNRLDQRDDARQIERLKKYPEQAGERYRQVQRNVADAAATGGFNFDNLFMGSNVDRRGEDEVRVRPEEDYTNISGSIDSTDKENPYVAAAANYGNTALGQYIDPNRYNAFRTNKAYGTSNRPSGLLGGLYDVLGGRTVDEVMSTYPDNTQAYNQSVGNTTETLLGAAVGSGLSLDRPPPGEGGQGGLLTDPRFNFDIGSFGGTGFLDSRLRKAIDGFGNGFGNGIGFSNDIPASIAYNPLSGLLGSGRGTINIGNVGNVVDQYGNYLTGNAANAYIQSQFEALQRRELGKRLRDYDLNII
jgi:hypothetical protein